MTELSPLLWGGGVSALVVGATSSPHCALMCGPLACAAVPQGSAARAGAKREAAIAWHAGRLGAYALCGVLLGALGQGIAAALALRVEPVLPWVMAVFLVVGALAPLVWSRGLLPSVRLGGGARAIARSVAERGPTLRAAAFGALTPLLPCGLLYGVFLAAAATGTALAGGGVMLLFALGGVPALAGAQAGARLFGAHPRVARLMRTVVPLAAAAVLI